MSKPVKANKSAAKKPTPAKKSAVAKKPFPAKLPAPAKQISAPEASEATTSEYAVINRRASDRLRAGHVWVYASDVEDVVANGNEAPRLLAVVDSRGILLGTALFSPQSQIQLRLISRELLSESEWYLLLAERLRAAIARRKPYLNKTTDSCRISFSEADEIPGLIIDKYADLVLVQFLSRGLDTAEARATVVEVLRDELKPATIIERPDARIREIEGMTSPTEEPLYSKTKTPKLKTTFHVNGLSFEYDAAAGQKTGAFLDQRLNYLAAANWAAEIGATGRVLDICTYQGGFALHLARVAKEVVGVDASRAALEVAEINLAENQSALKANVEWVSADAFDLLREWAKAGEKFDVIILDPPAFAKSKRAVEGAMRGYKELNLRALEMLNPGGLLVTCTCSHHIGWDDLEAALASAASDTGRRVRLLERRGAALDHPVVFTLPETEYLKALYCQVD